MSLFASGSFPPISPSTLDDVTVEERVTAIDFVNRVNYLFEEFNHDKMAESFMPDCKTFHFHGIIEGRDGSRRFFKEQYGYLIDGVSRHATNHVVDRDGQYGVLVRYHQHLVRYAWSADLESIKDSTIERSNDGLPALWLWTPMIDRLKKTDAGWKIAERHVGPGIFNKQLNTPKT